MGGGAMAGKIAPPDADEVRAGSAQAFVAARLGVQPSMNQLALDFGRQCGVVPDWRAGPTWPRP